MSGLKEQGDLFWVLTHQETQSGIFTRSLKFVVVRLFTADGNLLQPTVRVNRTLQSLPFSSPLSGGSWMKVDVLRSRSPPESFTVPFASVNMNFSPFIGVNASFVLNLFFLRTSEPIPQCLRPKYLLFQILRACNAYPMQKPGKTFGRN